jgi:hypothetical protein
MSRHPYPKPSDFVCQTCLAEVRRPCNYGGPGRLRPHGYRVGEAVAARVIMIRWQDRRIIKGYSSTQDGDVIFFMADK